MRRAMENGEKRNASRRKASPRPDSEDVPDIGPRADRPVCPRLSNILQQLMDSERKLSDERYPSTTANPFERAGAKHVIVFIVGGATLKEARCVREFNETHHQHMRVTLGGDRLLSAKEFLRALDEHHS